MSPRGFGSIFSSTRSPGRSRTSTPARRRTSTTRRMPLAAEHLESRTMLATTANLSGDISTFARIPVTFGSRPADYVGQFYWSGMTGDAAAVGLPPAFKSFCIEGLQAISPGSNTFDSLVPLTASTLLGSGRADQVTEFWRQYGPTASTGFTDNTDGAAFQLAIWEIINDGRPAAGQAATALAGGTFKVAATHLTAPAVARAAAWLNGTGTATVGGGAVALYALQSPTKQDQVVCVPVPSINIDATDAEADEVMAARDIPNTGRFRLSRSGDTSSRPIQRNAAGPQRHLAMPARRREKSPRRNDLQ